MVPYGWSCAIASKYSLSFVLNAAEVPAGNYDEVRRFFGAILKAEQTPVVLAHQ